MSHVPSITGAVGVRAGCHSQKRSIVGVKASRESSMKVACRILKCFTPVGEREGGAHYLRRSPRLDDASENLPKRTSPNLKNGEESAHAGPAFEGGASRVRGTFPNLNAVIRLLTRTATSPRSSNWFMTPAPVWVELLGYSLQDEGFLNLSLSSFEKAKTVSWTLCAWIVTIFPSREYHNCCTTMSFTTRQPVTSPCD